MKPEDVLKIEHHAFLLLGNRSAHYEHMRHFLREQTDAGILESADVWTREFDSFAIDDARELKQVQSTMPNGNRRIVLVSLQNIQHEAQHSLLKLFEEPSSATTFIVCADSSEIFIPTVLSRFSIHDLQAGEVSHKNTSASHTDTKKFLKQTVVERMTAVEPIIKEKDRGLAEQFLNSLETVMYEEKNSMPAEEAQFAFNQIFSARQFLRNRSSSVKMILEHICGIMPVLPNLPKK